MSLSTVRMSLTNAWMSLSTARMRAHPREREPDQCVDEPQHREDDGHPLATQLDDRGAEPDRRAVVLLCEGSGRRANPQKRQGEAGGAVRMPTTLLRRADAGLTQVERLHPL